MKDPLLCDRCTHCFPFLVVAWGRELTEIEKKCNAILTREGKAERCLAYERFFNKSFKKRKEHCEDFEEDVDWEEEPCPDGF